MITILFGPGGSGKSFYQLHLIVRKLVTSRQNIVTNLAIDVPALAAYIERTFPGVSVDVGARVRLLTVEETREFWKFRGRLRWKPGTDYDMEEDKGVDGVFFVIDEAGVAGFNAVGWATQDGRTTRGERAAWYLDQQRKFGDDVVASCNGRAPHGVAKPLRDKAHEFVQLRNGYQRQIGIFKARGQFTATAYLTEPGPNAEPFRKETFQLDVAGLASCYRTQDGVGVAGTKADIGRRAKGIPVLWAFPMAIGLASLCIFVPWLISKGFNRIMGTKAPAAQKAEQELTGAQALGKAVGSAVDLASVRVGEFTGYRRVQNGAADFRDEDPVWLDGIANGTAGPVAFLTSGEVLAPGQFAVMRFGVVDTFGNVFRWKPKRAAIPEDDRRRVESKSPGS